MELPRELAETSFTSSISCLWVPFFCCRLTGGGTVVAVEDELLELDDEELLGDDDDDDDEGFATFSYFFWRISTSFTSIPFANSFFFFLSSLSDSRAIGDLDLLLAMASYLELWVIIINGHL